ncbi:hypothetical protein M427DRAFT_233522 [Gonapodya prolifera JEL478]|uniref:SH3 domain-containing protein n=1 Tax=Gonapodya prolifera (strain JEL478) TaxID=1344416 RepID=A0A138ZXZ3_GONPJ|nr:hypothetical protein M427DRAFT_233522 [Gonapodya prolifera JEL478]|eukprot:KXS09370.1 hypothetical protein M427DRAFT_233522 [Gonapodya prolifera JEL478]
MGIAASQFSQTATDTDSEGGTPHWAFAQLVPPLYHHAPSYDVPGNSQFQAHTDYSPVNTDEIPVNQGDWMKLKTVFRDGWCFALNVDQEVFGLVPLDCLVIHPSATNPGFSTRSPNRIESLAVARSATIASNAFPVSTPLPAYPGPTSKFFGSGVMYSEHGSSGGGLSSSG